MCGAGAGGAGGAATDVVTPLRAPPGDAYALMSAVTHTELGGPTGSSDPDPVHPFRAVGAVTVARIEKRWLRG